MLFHIDAAAAKGDALRFKPESLFQAGFTTQLDLSARAEHALPGKTKRSTEYANNLPRSARMSGSARHRAIRRNLAARN